MNAAPTWYLRLFGSPSLGGGDGSGVAGRAVQRHRVALLALLALAPAQRLTRDKLIGYLWPESDQDRARNLLNVALYNLRKALGESAILSEGDDLRLNAEVLPTDVMEFEAALARGDHSAAAALYRGPFLDGFFVSDAPEFDPWAARERQRLADAFARSLEALAEDAERRRDFIGASEWWKARAAHDPYDSRVALRLMQALEASGNRARALQHGALHQRLLQLEFGVAAAPEVAALAERLRSTATADVSASPTPAATPDASDAPREVPDDRTPLVGVAPVDSAAPRPPRMAARRRGWQATGALAVLVGVAAAGWIFWPRAPRPEGSIVVLPFVNLSPSSNDHFSDGLTEEIITRLAAIPGLKVISRTSAMHYKGTRKPLGQIAGELNVAHVLEGSVREHEGSLRISAQLVDARTDAHLWADQFDYELRDPFRVQEEMARAVATALEVELGDRARRLLARRGTNDPETYELYRRGRYLWSLRTREGHEQALAYFAQAIARDSHYADAYAGVADVYLTAWQLNLADRSEQETYSRLKWAAERALALDDESADAHVSFAIALWWQKNWPGAEREMRRAIELNPGHAIAHTWYSLLLRGMGRPDEARREARLGAELDPFAVIPLATNGWQHYNDRDFDGAIVQLVRATQVGAYGGAWAGLAEVYALKGMPDSALRAARRAVELSPERPGILAVLAYAQAVAGQRAEARETLRRVALEPLEPFDHARAWVALGEPDSAFAWLERARWQWPHRALLADPALDPLRADPRYARLSARIAREMGLK